MGQKNCTSNPWPIFKNLLLEFSKKICGKEISFFVLMFVSSDRKK